MLEWTLEIDYENQLYTLKTRGNEFTLSRSEFLKLYELLADAVIFEEGNSHA